MAAHVQRDPATAAGEIRVIVDDDSILDSPYDDGTKKALKKGKTTVTITAPNGKSVKVEVNVK